MKKLLIVSNMVLAGFSGFAQQKAVNTEFEIMSNYYDHSQTLIVLNSKLITREQFRRDSLYLKNNLELIFAEGDEGWLKWYYGNTKKDNSIITQYYGKYRANGINYFYTKDKIRKISKQEFISLTSVRNEKHLFYAGNAPITHILPQKGYEKIKNIYIIPDFRLMKWDTGKLDSFTLFYVSYYPHKKG